MPSTRDASGSCARAVGRRGRIAGDSRWRERVRCTKGLEDALPALHGETGHGADLFGGRIADCLKAAEGREQESTLRIADTGNSEQLRGEGARRPPLALEGDGETVRFVARLL